MPDSKKNHTWVNDQSLSYCDNANNFGMNKLVKGPPIVNENSYEKRCLECRINLSRRFFRVGTLPNYESVVEVENQSLIESAESFRFVLAGLNPKTKMTILKLQKVESFDASM